MPAASIKPLNLNKWIEENRHLLRPPVGNQQIWKDQDFIIFVSGGPNSRNDFHINPTEEFFYQLEGDIVVRIRHDDGTIEDVKVREGEIFLVPSMVPHSPQRPVDTVGLVVEYARPPGAEDHQAFFCANCGTLVHDNAFILHDIVGQFKQAMEDFWAMDIAARTCKKCGTVVVKPEPLQAV